MRARAASSSGHLSICAFPSGQSVHYLPLETHYIFLGARQSVRELSAIPDATTIRRDDCNAGFGIAQVPPEGLELFHNPRVDAGSGDEWECTL